MMTIAQIKTFAKRQLRGNLMSAIGAMILSFICTILWVAVLSSAVFFGVIAPVVGDTQIAIISTDMRMRLLFFSVVGIALAAILLLGAYMFLGLMLGNQMLYLNIARGKRVGAFEIFKGFGNPGHMGHYFGVVLIIYIIEMLFMVPETIMGLRYGYASMDYNVTSAIGSFLLFIISLYLCMSSFASASHPDMGAFRAIRVSIHLMRRRKLKLIGFELSFIGWFLLGVCTMGLAFFWIIPYFNTAYTIFYLSAYGQDYESKIRDAEYREAGVGAAGAAGIGAGVSAGSGAQGSDATGAGAAADANADGHYTEPRDTYVRGDARPEDEPRKSFEEVRSQYTDIKDESSGIGAQSANSYEAGIYEASAHNTIPKETKDSAQVTGEWHSQTGATVAQGAADSQGALDAQGVSDVGPSAAGAAPETEVKKSYKTEADAFAAYEQWKRDHGITIENRDPFHNIYQSDGRIAGEQTGTGSGIAESEATVTTDTSAATDNAVTSTANNAVVGVADDAVTGAAETGALDSASADAVDGAVGAVDNTSAVGAADNVSSDATSEN